MTNGRFIDATPEFEKRGNLTRPGDLNKPKLGQVIYLPSFGIPEPVSEPLPVDIKRPSQAAMFNGFENSAGQIVEVLQKEGYGDIAENLRDACITALYDGDSVNRVRIFAEGCLFATDEGLYTRFLNGVDFFVDS